MGVSSICAYLTFLAYVHQAACSDSPPYSQQNCESQSVTSNQLLQTKSKVEHSVLKTNVTVVHSSGDVEVDHHGEVAETKLTPDAALTPDAVLSLVALGDQGSLPPTEEGCADTEGPVLSGRSYRLCWDWADRGGCSDSNIKSKCPLSCAQCAPPNVEKCEDVSDVNLGSGSGCVDSQGNEVPCTCRGSSGYCHYNFVKFQCPETCGVCTPTYDPCEDSSEFYIEWLTCTTNEKEVPCTCDRSSSSSCSSADWARKCPVTCGKCQAAPTPAPAAPALGGCQDVENANIDSVNCKDSRGFEKPCGCRTFEAYGYCRKQEVNTLCPARCGACKPTIEKCEDASEVKLEWITAVATCDMLTNYCNDVDVWRRCPVTCGKCVPAGTPGSSCQDNIDCKHFKDYCSYSSIRRDCMKTCQQC